MRPLIILLISCFCLQAFAQNKCDELYDYIASKDYNRLAAELKNTSDCSCFKSTSHKSSPGTKWHPGYLIKAFILALVPPTQNYYTLATELLDNKASPQRDSILKYIIPNDNYLSNKHFNYLIDFLQNPSNENSQAIFELLYSKSSYYKKSEAFGLALTKNDHHYLYRFLYKDNWRAHELDVLEKIIRADTLDLFYKIVGDFKINVNSAYGNRKNTLLHEICTKTYLKYYSNKALVAVVDFYARRGFNFFITNDDNETVLLRSILNENKVLFDVFISYPFNKNYKHTTKNTYVHYAARNGNAYMVQKLIELGCPYNTKNVFGETPLMLTDTNNYYMVELLHGKVSAATKHTEMLKTYIIRNKTTYSTNEQNKIDSILSTGEYRPDKLTTYCIEKNNFYVFDRMLITGIYLPEDNQLQPVIKHALKSSNHTYINHLIKNKRGVLRIVLQHYNTETQLRNWLDNKSLFLDSLIKNNVVITKDPGGKYRITDKLGTSVISAEFDSVIVSNRYPLYMVKSSSGWSVIDIQNKHLLRSHFKEISLIHVYKDHIRNDFLFLVKNGGQLELRRVEQFIDYEEVKPSILPSGTTVLQINIKPKLIYFIVEERGRQVLYDYPLEGHFSKLDRKFRTADFEEIQLLPNGCFAFKDEGKWAIQDNLNYPPKKFTYLEYRISGQKNIEVRKKNK